MNIYFKGAVSAAALMAAVTFAHAQTGDRGGAGAQPDSNMQGGGAAVQNPAGDDKKPGGQQKGMTEKSSDGKPDGKAAQSDGKPDGKASDAKPDGKSAQPAAKPDGKSAETGQRDEKPGDGRSQQSGAQDKKDDRSAQDKGDTKRDGAASGQTGRQDNAKDGGDKNRNKTTVNINIGQEQKTRVRDVIRRDTGIRRYRRSEFNVTLNVGTRIPDTIVYYDAPSSIIEIVPDYQRYKVIVLDDVILIIDPETREIVDVIQV